MKSTTVRGTPYHHVSAAGTAHQGVKAGLKGMEGTTPSEYSSDKRGYQSDPRSGTPYQSQRGNGPEYRREVARGNNLESADHGNQNDPASNGVGVMLDGANEYSRGYTPRDERTLDSPVPAHAAIFRPGFIKTEDEAHAGTGNERTARDNILEIGGVMSRGMVGTSSSRGPETELMEDDDMGLEGRATRSQPQGSTRHEKE